MLVVQVKGVTGQSDADRERVRQAVEEAMSQFEAFAAEQLGGELSDPESAIVRTFILYRLGYATARTTSG